MAASPETERVEPAWVENVKSKMFLFCASWFFAVTATVTLPSPKAPFKGNRVKKEDGGNTWYRVDDKGEYLREFKINGKLVGAFNKDTALETVLTSINGNADAGVTVNYSKTTNQFQFTTRETGASSQIKMGDGLAKTLFPCLAFSS